MDAQRLQPLVLSVDRAGRLYLNMGGDPGVAVGDAAIALRAAAVLRRNPDVPVLVKADRAVPYGRVVQAMVILQRAGAHKLGFITDPLPPPVQRGS
jgi:biopolymer transport protein TolR